MKNSTIELPTIDLRLDAVPLQVAMQTLMWLQEDVYLLGEGKIQRVNPGAVPPPTVHDPSTLLRFYILHCVAVPLLASVLIALHFWRVRKDGGISGPL